MQGRRIIYTDEKNINVNNVESVLRQAMITHSINVDRMNYLINYEEGVQPINREKKYRADINCIVEDNIANEIVEFKTGYNWGYPITFVQRGESDSGTSNEPKSIALLNECYDAAGNKKNKQELARFIEITGIGYTYTDINTDYTDGESPFINYTLDPRNAFVVRSSSVGHKVLMGVTYSEDILGNKHYTCFTKDKRFEIDCNYMIVKGKNSVEEKWDFRERNGESNPLGVIPIVEWIRSFDRMGCFERQLSEMNNLNLMVSDYSNSVEQNVQCIWHSNDVDFPMDADGNTIAPKSNDWLQTFTTADGKTPFVTPLAQTYDYGGMLNNIVNRRALILQKCNVPCRNDNSGGSTGVAMDSATGWSAAETAACKEQIIIEDCVMDELKVVLSAIRKSAYPDNELRRLKFSDVKPNIKRQKTYELAVKSNAFATFVSHGIYGKHAIDLINAFDDPNQVWEDSQDTITMYQNSIFNNANSAVGGDGESKPNADRLMQDESDQVTNSPNIDGMSTNGN